MPTARLMANGLLPACTLIVASLGGGCADDGSGGSAWVPGASAGPGTSAATEDGGDTGAASTSTGGDLDCTPGSDRPCTCSGSGSDGFQECATDGMGYGDCDCGEGSSTGGSTTGDSGEAVTEACYPGEDGSYSVCFDLIPFEMLPEGYTYPEPRNGQASYRRPIALLDLEGLDPELRLAPNFRLSEIARPDLGRYAIIQPHAIESLQSLRDMLGSINVTSGYRSPSQGVGVEGSDPYSRHMYGDGFDLVAAEASRSQLEAACQDIGGVLGESGSAVHCDFRNDPLDEGFFGP